MLDNQAYVWFGKLVAFGELAIGIALILGAFTGLAAFAGGFMNWNFMMAGTASTNPLLFALGVLLILSWKTAGYWGLDRFLLPILGTLLTLPAAFAANWAMGRVAMEYFKNPGNSGFTAPDATCEADFKHYKN